MEIFNSTYMRPRFCPCEALGGGLRGLFWGVFVFWGCFWVFYLCVGLKSFSGFCEVGVSMLNGVVLHVILVNVLDLWFFWCNVVCIWSLFCVGGFVFFLVGWVVELCLVCLWVFFCVCVCFWFTVWR